MHDETYNTLYVDDQNLDVFYHAAKLGKIVELCLKKSNIYTQAQKNDIMFYVFYYSVAKKMRKSKITLSEVKELDLNLFTEEYILEIASHVFDEYNRLGGNGKVAKGSELIVDLMDSITIDKESSSTLT